MTTRLGFIGFGIMGERLLRAALSHDRDTIQVVGVFDPSARAQTKLHTIDPRLMAFESASDVIAAADCLHIASPPLSHLDYLTQCHASGKAALCEKPLATSVETARAAVTDLKTRNIRAAKQPILRAWTMRLRCRQSWKLFCNRPLPSKISPTLTGRGDA